SFWSSYLGKDALAFMACTFLLWSALDLKKRKVLLFFSIFIMLMVRPHIAVAMATAAILAFIFDKRTNFYSRLFMGSISLITLVSILPLMLNRLGLEDTNDISDINDYVNQRQSYNLDGGSSVDISNMS